MRRPFVRESYCTGCGLCERVCPVKPEAAIIVERREDQSGERVPWGDEVV